MDERIKNLYEATTKETSVFDLVNQKDYSTYPAYLDALINKRMQMNTQEYADAHRAIQRQLEGMIREEMQKENRAALEATIQAVQLNPIELEKIEKEAIDLANKEMANGKISSNQFKAAVTQHEKELTEKAKRQKGTNQFLNEALRDAFTTHNHGGSVSITL